MQGKAQNDQEEQQQTNKSKANAYFLFEAIVGIYLLAAGTVSLWCYEPHWSLALIIIGAFGLGLCTVAWIVFAHEQGERVDRDTAEIIACGTTLGLILEGLMCALNFSLDLGPMNERKAAGIFYGVLASALPFGYYCGTIMYHYTFYDGRAKGLAGETLPLTSQKEDGFEPMPCRWAPLIQFAILALSYTVFFLTDETWWLSAVFLVVCALAPLVFGLLSGGNNWKMPKDFACLLALWKAASIAMLFQVALTFAARGFWGYGMPSAAERSPAVLIYGSIATLMPTCFFKVTMMMHEQFRAGYLYGLDEAALNAGPSYY